MSSLSNLGLQISEQIKKDAETIDRLGGSTKVSRMLGFPKEIGTQRVNNWKRRGIPARIKLDFPKIFLAKARKSK
jgi:hypothetical protein